MKLHKKIVLICVLALSFLFTACSATDNSAADLPDINYNNFHNIHNSQTVSDSEYKYLAVKDAIYKAPLGTEDFQCIYRNENIVINKIALADDRLYFSSVCDLYSVDKDGGNRQHVFMLAELYGTIYWEDFFVAGNDVFLEKGDSLVFRLEKTDTGFTAVDPQPVIYSNSRGMEYEFIRSDEMGGGKLHSMAENTATPADMDIYNENSFILTDNYIFYVSGKTNDISADMKIYRCNPDGSNTLCVAEFNSTVQPVSYDGQYVYFKTPSHYYRIQQNINGKHRFKEEDDVEYYGGPYEICDGRLYSVLTTDPQVIYFDSGMCEYINLK